MTLSRRSLFTGFAAILAAPAIVRATSLMPVKAFVGDGVALQSTSHPEWVDVVPANFQPMRMLELAQLKVEGTAINFDYGLNSYMIGCGVRIRSGDGVSIGPDGCAYRMHADMTPDKGFHFAGFAVADSQFTVQ